jgi:hypothetical protein
MGAITDEAIAGGVRLITYTPNLSGFCKDFVSLDKKNTGM